MQNIEICALPQLKRWLICIDMKRIIRGSHTVRWKAEDGKPGEDAIYYKLKVMKGGSVITSIPCDSQGVPKKVEAVTVYLYRVVGRSETLCSNYYWYMSGMQNGAVVYSSQGGLGSYLTFAVDRTDVDSFRVRVYEASNMGGNIIAEVMIPKVLDGKEGNAGRSGYTYRPRGFFKQGNSYIYDDEYRDVVIHKFSGIAHVFRVRNKGATITAAPTSTAGDSNWEAANELSFVATDFVLARQIHANEIDGTNLEVIDGRFTGSIATPPVVLTGDGNVSLNFSTGFNFAAFANTGERKFILPTDKKYNGVNSIITHLGGYDIKIELENGNIRCGSSLVRTLILPGYGMAYLYSVLPNPDNETVIWYVINNSSFIDNVNTAVFKKQ